MNVNNQDVISKCVHSFTSRSESITELEFIHESDSSLKQGVGSRTSPTIPGEVKNDHQDEDMSLDNCNRSLYFYRR